MRWRVVQGSEKQVYNMPCINDEIEYMFIESVG